MNIAVLMPENAVAKSKSTRRGNRRPLAKGFRLGDRVRVREGVRTSQRPGILLEDWTGKVVHVFETNPPAYAIRWSSATLASLPPQIRKLYRTSRNGKASYEERLYGDELVHNRAEETTTPRPTSGWDSPSTSASATDLCWKNRDDRIRSVFGLRADEPLPPVTLDNLWRYANYLQLYMGDVEWLEGTYVSENGYRTYGRFKIARDSQGDFDWDFNCGVLCWFGRKEEAVQVCLSQMQLPVDSPYFEIVEDYRHWNCEFAASTQFSGDACRDDWTERTLSRWTERVCQGSI